MQFTIRDLLNSVFRHSRSLLIFAGVLVVAVVVFFTQNDKSYESTAKILISLGSEAQGKAEYLNEKNLQVLQREQQIHNEQQILESHDVLLTTAKWVLGDETPTLATPAMDASILDARRYITDQAPKPTLLLRLLKSVTSPLAKALSKPKTHSEELEDIAKTFSDDLTVKAIFDSDALDVSFRYRDPRVAQTILKLILQAYVDHHIAVFQSSNESALLKTQLDRSLDDYNKQLGVFSSYMTTHHVYNDDSQVNALIEQRERLEQALREASADQAASEARLHSMDGVSKTLEPYERYSTTETRNKEHDTLATKLNQALVDQQALLTRHPVGSRAYEDQDALIAAIRPLLAQEPTIVVDQTEQRRNPASELVQSAIITETGQQSGDQARIAKLRDGLFDLDRQMQSYTKGLEGLNALKLNVQFAKQKSEQLSQAFVDSNLRTLTSQNSITDVSVIDGPTWDFHPVSPKLKTTVAAAMGMLIMGSIAVLLACIALDTTVSDSRTAESRLGAPVVATIPAFGSEAGSLISPESISPETFSLENQREFARIYHSMATGGQSCPVILISESHAGEGASLVGYSFARFLSNQTRKKTGFLDCTLQPVSDLPSAFRSAQPAIEDQEPVLLSNLESGRSAAFRGSDWAAEINQLRQKFGYIVIAGGAVKDATELLTAGGIVTASFLLVEAGKTRIAAIRNSLDLLKLYGFSSVRLILNKRVYFLPAWLMRFL